MNTKNPNPGFCLCCSKKLTSSSLLRYCDADCRDKTRIINFESKYKMRKWKALIKFTPQMYDEAVKKQNNVCAICKTDKPGGSSKRNWYVDHDHMTGEFRGLLCMNCNVALGNFKDNVNSLKAAIQYLSRGEIAY